MTPGILDLVREWLGRYIRTVSEGDLDLLTLWAAHTHLALEVYSSPRLLVDSPMPGSGKTTCLEHLARLCVEPVQMAAVSSSALLVRLLQDSEGNSVIRTLLIDEADRTLRPDNPSTPDIVAILNSGYKRGATRPVLVPLKDGWASKEMSTFAPVAMAGNSPNLPEDTRSRTIRVLLLPDLDGTVEESDWELIDDDARRLGSALAAWAAEKRELVSAERPAMPEGVIGRFREKWQPLARVAAAAGGRWPAVVEHLAVKDVEQVRADREDGMMIEQPHIVLLKHLNEVWPQAEPFVATEDLVASLKDHFPDSWGPGDRYRDGLTQQRFGRMLARHYGVNSGRLTTGRKSRGYFLEDVRPVMDRLGIGGVREPAKPVDPVQPAPEPREVTGSTTWTGMAGSIETPQSEAVHCRVCGQPLDASSLDDGFTTCPSCEMGAAS